MPSLRRRAAMGVQPFSEGSACPTRPRSFGPRAEARSGRYARSVSAGGLGLRASVDAEGGDGILVQLEPDAVAGVDVGAVDEGGLACLGARPCGGEACAVSVEACEQVPESVVELSLIHISEPTRRTPI